MADKSEPDRHHVWPMEPKLDGRVLWGWQVMRDGRVIALGECTSEAIARRAMEAAAKNHGQPLVDPQ